MGGYGGRRGRDEEVGGQVVKQLGEVDSGAMIAREHILGVTRVAGSPCLIMQRIDEAGAVIALVECNGNEARGGTDSCGSAGGVVAGDDVRGQGRHGAGIFQARVQ